MADSQPKLSSRSIAILKMIADGNSYEQILVTHTDFNYLDIFRAAAEALSQDTQQPLTPKYTIAQKRERHPRAYELWTDAEDAQLRQLAQDGATVAQIAGRLQRNRGAIRSRIVKLGLVLNLTVDEQKRLLRLVEFNDPP